MNKHQFLGKWTELKGKVREKWGKLTDDEVEELKGDYDQFVGKLQQKYGYTKEKAEEELSNWKW